MPWTWSRLVVSVCLVSACAHHEEVKAPDPITFRMQDQSVTLIQEARKEAQRLRSELAAAKIAGAKLAAELKSLKEEADRLRAREKELGTRVQQFQEEVMALQTERDALRRRNAELQAQSAALPALHHMADQLEDQQVLLEQLVGTVQSLTVDMAAMKQDLVEARRVASSRSTDVGMNGRSREQTGPRFQTVIVKPRDTLWRIARAHGVSVKQLQQLNGLTSSLIRVGQRLKVPNHETSHQDAVDANPAGTRSGRLESHEASSQSSPRSASSEKPIPAPNSSVHPREE